MENKSYDPNSVRQHLLTESIAMVKYALASGKEVNPSIVKTIETFCAQVADTTEAEENSVADQAPATKKPINSRPLVLAHNQLAKIIAPATPRTVVLLEEGAHSHSLWGRSLGSVPLIRQLIFGAVIFLLLFLLVGLSPAINEENITKNFTQLSGLDLLINETFLLAAAGLGACFAALFKANRYITRGTFDPKYTPSYWIQVALGIIAGIILAELITFNTSSATDSIQAFTKPMLALVGGFSASAVYQILRQVINALESLVKGDMQDNIDAQRSILQANANQVVQEERIKTAASLIKLKDQVVSGTDSDELQKVLNQLLTELLDTDVSNAAAQINSESTA